MERTPLLLDGCPHDPQEHEVQEESQSRVEMERAELPGLDELIGEQTPDLPGHDGLAIEPKQHRISLGILNLEAEKGDIQEQQDVDRPAILALSRDHGHHTGNVSPREKSSAHDDVLESHEHHGLPRFHAMLL